MLFTRYLNMSWPSSRTVLHTLQWKQIDQTVVTQGVESQVAGSFNAFTFTDVASGLEAVSPAVYGTDEWHFVMVTADKSGRARLSITVTRAASLHSSLTSL
jgi:hypothetical protein